LHSIFSWYNFAIPMHGRCPSASPGSAVFRYAILMLRGIKNPVVYEKVSGKYRLHKHGSAMKKSASVVHD